MQTAKATTDTQVIIRDFSELMTIRGLVEQHPDKFKENQLRWLLRFRERNGLDAATVKIGKTLYLHVPTLLNVFNSWRGAA